MNFLQHALDNDTSNKLHRRASTSVRKSKAFCAWNNCKPRWSLEELETRWFISERSLKNINYFLKQCVKLKPFFRQRGSVFTQFLYSMQLISSRIIVAWDGFKGTTPFRKGLCLEKIIRIFNFNLFSSLISWHVRLDNFLLAYISSNLSMFPHWVIWRSQCFPCTF